MKMKEVKRRAEKFGIEPGDMDKKTIIQMIQVAEGNEPCFQNKAGVCDQAACCWRGDCVAG